MDAEDHMNKLQLLQLAMDEFRQTAEAKWVNENDVKLEWAVDDNYLAWNKQIIFYGDVTSEQYTDYALRFM